ncbi:MAG: hypothetical protein KDB61_05590 [Planctomycetes bacterium]|nr:hypothetical protein [Planctomycetota bacterium]
MEDKLTTRNADGTFAPGNPGKAPGTLTKARRKLRELVEAEAEGDPLPVRMVRIGKRAEDQGEDALALTAYAAAAQYTYGKVKPREEANEGEGTGLPRGTSFKIVGPHEDPTPEYPGQRVLIDPTRHEGDGVTSDRGWVDRSGEFHRIRFVKSGSGSEEDPGTTRIDFRDAL